MSDEIRAACGTPSEPQVPDDAIVGIYAGRIRQLETENAELRERLYEARADRDYWKSHARRRWLLREEIRNALGVHDGADPDAAIDQALGVIAEMKRRIAELEKER